MTAIEHKVEHLDLRFRTEPAPPAPRWNVPGGLFLCCIVGIGIGVGAWFLGKQSLKANLTEQLATAENTAEAMLAVEGLLMLDENASTEIVGGLQHPNIQVARTAYKTLNAQITRWQQLEPTIANAHMRTLATHLEELPTSTPASNLVLASSLASRIFASSLEQDDPLLQPVLVSCEAVFRRAGAAHAVLNAAPTDTEQATLNTIAAQIESMAPPPPLAPIEAADALEPSQPPKPAAQQTQFTSEPPANVLRDPLPTIVSPPTASLRLVANRTRTRESERTEPSSSYSGSVSLSDNTAAASLSDDYEETSFSLSDDGDSFSLSDNVQSPTVQSPTPVSLQPPLANMRVTANKPDLNGIQDLEIEELVRLLSSVQPSVVQSAALALKNKGMDDAKLALASELATCSAARRMELVTQIASNGELEPRPWLLWMAEDGEPEVRKLSVSLLSSMVDPYVERRLRTLLNREREPSVENAIREALLAGSRKIR